MKPKTAFTTIFVTPFLVAIWIYQKLVSAFLPSSCIYYPSCSEYSKQAFKKHGMLWGLYLSIHRILRCHPFHLGGADEVPNHASFFNFRQIKQDRVQSNQP